jgi:hypothetical protein
MKRRLESLATMQEQLLRDMELVIQKREDIAVKYSNKKTDNSRNSLSASSASHLISKGKQAK